MLDNSDNPYPSHIEKYYVKNQEFYDWIDTLTIILLLRAWLSNTRFCTIEVLSMKPEMPGQQLSREILAKLRANKSFKQSRCPTSWHYPTEKKTGSVMSCRKVDATAMM